MYGQEIWQDIKNVKTIMKNQSNFEIEFANGLSEQQPKNGYDLKTMICQT